MKKDQSLSCSVIIPTRGRDACVRRTLADLNTQSYTNFDVWLVDQNDKPLLALESSIDPKKLKHIPMKPLGSHAGRNRAIFETESDIVIFVDDDVRLQVDFIEKHVNAHLQNKDSAIAVFAGRVVQPRDGYSIEQMRLMGKPARYNPWLGVVSGNFVGEKKAEVQHIHECNFSIRTDILKKVGGFNEEFRGNAYFEGAELALRILKAGYKIIYDPALVLVHLQDNVGGNRVQKKEVHTYWFMRNYGLLNSLHMHKLGVPLFASYGFAYVLGKSLKNRNSVILREGLKGLYQGLEYFLPGKTKLRLGARK